MKYQFVLIALFLVNPMYAFDYQFIDGSGNSYKIIQGSGIRLNYDPITPEMSSSGLYSGGEPNSSLLAPGQLKDFENLIQTLNLKEGKAPPDRKKGTSIFIRISDKKTETFHFVIHDPKAKKIETFLKDCIKSSNESGEMKLSPTNKYLITRDESPWNGMTGSYEEEEKSKKIFAQNAKTIGLIPISTPKEIIFQNESLLYYTQNPKSVVVDQKYFSNLTRVDVTKLKKEESLLIGNYHKQSGINELTIINFLIKGQILISYWHMDAELKFISEEKSVQKKCFSFLGKHHYYTNEKNTGHYSFKLCLDSENGEITVIGN